MAELPTQVLAVFRQGAYYSHIVVSEDAPGLVRFSLVALTLICALIALVRVLQEVRGGQPSRWLSPGARQTLIWLFLANLFTHTWHYADNIYRPVAYAEPQWLYSRWLLFEMEITFANMWPMTAFLVYGTRQWLRASCAEELRRGRLALLVYAFMSAEALGHYLVMPFSHYDADVNASISGEGISAIVLALWVLKTHGGLAAKAASSSSSAAGAQDEQELARLVPGSGSSAAGAGGGAGAGAGAASGGGAARRRSKGPTEAVLSVI